MAGLPSKIMLMRHAEKPPAQGGPPFGVTVDGGRSVHALSVRGWQRAGALGLLFARGESSPPRGLAVPARLVCAHDGGATEKRRVYQTLIPLADRLGLGVEHPLPASAASFLYEEALAGMDGAVLVCWDHHGLPEIAASIPVTPTTAVPTGWAADRFDLVWVFDLVLARRAYRFRAVPQLALADDNG